MTLVLVRKLLRDVRWPLLIIWLLLFLFGTMWVRVTHRVTTEISPYFALIGGLAGAKQKDMEDILFSGVGKVSQAVLGGSDIHFDRPTDFLAVALLHPVVVVLAFLWCVGRAAGALSGELDRGTMELLLSQPVPRDRLILSHLIVDLLLIPLLCSSLWLGTHLGLASTGPFVENAEIIAKVREKAPPVARAFIKNEPAVLPVTVEYQWKGLLNLAALMFAMSGVSLGISSAGRNRWRTSGLAALLIMTMFVVNVIAQLYEPLAWLRPFTLFFYYQPQMLWLNDVWLADIGPTWGLGERIVAVPMVLFLFTVGTAGYYAALRIFSRRDLPAPL